jgi:hypothetical protein
VENPRAQMHLFATMINLPFSVFVKRVEFLATRRDESGFRRVWGYAVDRSNRLIVFYRHKRGRFTFKLSDTYFGSVTISDKVREKITKGYGEISGVKLERCTALLRTIHHDFLDAKERGLFHGG